MVQGALAALRSDGMSAGVYSTRYQWGEITGSLREPGMPTWGPTVPANHAAWAEDCTKSRFDFAGGTTWLIQWLGGTGNGPYDSDIACNP